MDAFDGLADPVRRTLLRRLAVRPLRAGELARGHGISRPAVSRHLRVLTEARLVEVEATGRERVYRLRADGTAPVRELLDELAGHGAAHAAPGEGRLTEEHLLALDTEVRRTARDRRQAARAPAGPLDGSTTDRLHDEESA